MDQSLSFIVRTATVADAPFAEAICAEMAASALARGTGIARRTPDYIARKMEEGKAVIAFSGTGAWAGFCYIETWSGDYVANSGLIVSPAFRKSGLARRIKERIFQLSREKYPQARIFGLTTGLAVMKINSDLGYEPVTYSELTPDDAFWSGCKSCVNYAILMDKQRKNCLCTAMLYDPAEARPDAHRATPAAAKAEGSGPRATPGERFRRKAKAYARYMRLKTARMLNGRSLLVTFLPFLQPLLQRP